MTTGKVWNILNTGSRAESTVLSAWANVILKGPIWRQNPHFFCGSDVSIVHRILSLIVINRELIVRAFPTKIDGKIN